MNFGDHNSTHNIDWYKIEYLFYLWRFNIFIMLNFSSQEQDKIFSLFKTYLYLFYQIL